MKTEKVIMVWPEQPPEVTTVASFFLELLFLVNNTICCFYPFEADDICVICYDNAKSLGLPYNRTMKNPHTSEPLGEMYGPFIILATNNGGLFRGLTEEEINLYIKSI